MNIIERVQAPTPKFFRVLRTIGLTLAAVSGAIFAVPVALPAAIVTAAGYMAVAGTIITAVSQTAVNGETDDKINPGNAGGAVIESPKRKSVRAKTDINASTN